jgi:hypothetical protein
MKQLPVSPNWIAGRLRNILFRWRNNHLSILLFSIDFGP